jgi:hypothetical protein
VIFFAKVVSNPRLLIVEILTVPVFAFLLSVRVAGDVEVASLGAIALALVAGSVRIAGWES